MLIPIAGKVNHPIAWKLKHPAVDTKESPLAPSGLNARVSVGFHLPGIITLGKLLKRLPKDK
jgi:hypothetical protein